MRRFLYHDSRVRFVSVIVFSAILFARNDQVSAIEKSTASTRHKALFWCQVWQRQSWSINTISAILLSVHFYCGRLLHSTENWHFVWAHSRRPMRTKSGNRKGKSTFLSVLVPWKTFPTPDDGEKSSGFQLNLGLEIDAVFTLSHRRPIWTARALDTPLKMWSGFHRDLSNC